MVSYDTPESEKNSPNSEIKRSSRAQWRPRPMSAGLNRRCWYSLTVRASSILTSCQGMHQSMPSTSSKSDLGQFHKAVEDQEAGDGVLGVVFWLGYRCHGPELAYCPQQPGSPQPHPIYLTWHWQPFSCFSRWWRSWGASAAQSQDSVGRGNEINHRQGVLHLLPGVCRHRWATMLRKV
jgi:hypothetical protein